MDLRESSIKIVAETALSTRYCLRMKNVRRSSLDIYNATANIKILTRKIHTKRNWKKSTGIASVIDSYRELYDIGKGDYRASQQKRSATNTS